MSGLVQRRRFARREVERQYPYIFLPLQAAQSWLPFLPHHMLHTGPATAAKFSEQYDQVGGQTDRQTDSQTVRQSD